MLKNSKLTIWISAIPLLFIVKFTKENPYFTEVYYSQLFYPWVFEIHRFFFNKFPFSDIAKTEIAPGKLFATKFVPSTGSTAISIV